MALQMMQVEGQVYLCMISLISDATSIGSLSFTSKLNNFNINWIIFILECESYKSFNIFKASKHDYAGKICWLASSLTVEVIIARDFLSLDFHITISFSDVGGFGLVVMKTFDYDIIVFPSQITSQR